MNKKLYSGRTIIFITHGYFIIGPFTRSRNWSYSKGMHTFVALDSYRACYLYITHENSESHYFVQ